MVIVCVAGTKGSGKDTVCDHLVAKHGFKKFAFADALKRVALPLIHAMWPDALGHLTLADLYDPEEKERVYPAISFGGKPFSLRWFLQFLGTDVMRANLSDTIWVDTVCKAVSAELRADPAAKICVSDCRFDNEVGSLRALGAPCVALRVHRPSSPGSAPAHGTPPKPLTSVHVSELQGFGVDHNIHNDRDLTHLYGLVDEALKAYV